MTPLFSIIIPSYRSEPWIEETLESVAAQTLAPYLYQVIVVDDCSPDRTYDIVTRFASGRRNWFAYRQDINHLAPGNSRNFGIEVASGDYLLFLDDDDLLEPHALAALRDAIMTARFPDLIAFDFCHTDDPPDAPGRRIDLDYLEDQDTRIARSLRLQTDGSVAFTLFRRQFLNDSFAPIRFRVRAVHDDLDLMFRAYRECDRVAVVRQPLLRRTIRDGSMAHSIDDRHLQGFFAAWYEVSQWIYERQEADYRIGFTAVIATRLREIVRWEPEEQRRRSLYYTLKAEADLLTVKTGLMPDLGLTTQYGRLALRFIAIMDHGRISEVTRMAEDLLQKSWGCRDLYYNRFYNPEGINSCIACDVGENGDRLYPTLLAEHPRDDASGRRKFLGKLNQGDFSSCAGCPYLDFRAWPPIADDFHPIGIIHTTNTLCNLDCSYCYDAYKDGRKAEYDVSEDLEDLHRRGLLDRLNFCQIVGGEPSIDKDLPRTLETIERLVPDTQFLINTNAVKHSPTFQRLLDRGKARLLTSIDAGTRRTFQTIRGRDSFRAVLKTLSLYLESHPERVMLKWIFTEGNVGRDEVIAFAELVRDQGWTGAYFCIAYDVHLTVASDLLTDLTLDLHERLRQLGTRGVCFEAFTQTRMPDPSYQPAAHVRSAIECPRDPDTGEMKTYIVVGAGETANRLLKAPFFQGARVAFIAAPGLTSLGYCGETPVSPLARVLESDLPIIILATGNYPVLREELYRMNVPASRIVTRVIPWW